MQSVESLLGLGRGSGLEKGAPSYSCAQKGAERRGSKDKGRKGTKLHFCPPVPCAVGARGVRDS